SLVLSEIAAIWKGGCIIRARFLDEIERAYAENPNLPNLIFDRIVQKELLERMPALRKVVAKACEEGIPVPALGSALAYFEALRSAELPQNLIQAQRDFFGAHTYRRKDREGTFHTNWE